MYSQKRKVLNPKPLSIVLSINEVLVVNILDDELGPLTPLEFPLSMIGRNALLRDFSNLSPDKEKKIVDQEESQKVPETPQSQADTATPGASRNSTTSILN
ncbi:hypothetical protein L1987_24046 [Smallanthus sonchifolius]|uniref:Uncharacterized protein n=1 Tax=Smallanthus sonchifolius TaxID=185202 RepID=A0ACB9IIK8_9ASTR|nr:hypothetical protein L1987_24046 [Smallanthus sonchifolius]